MDCNWNSYSKTLCQYIIFAFWNISNESPWTDSVLKKVEPLFCINVYPVLAPTLAADAIQKFYFCIKITTQKYNKNDSLAWLLRGSTINRERLLLPRVRSMKFKSLSTLKDSIQLSKCADLQRMKTILTFSR